MWEKIKNNLLLIAISVGSIIIFLMHLKINSLNTFIYNSKINKKEEISKVKDSLINIYTEKVNISNKRFDSIINLPPKIKWKKYEVPTYINRTLDDALNIHAEYKTNRLSR